MFLDTFPLLILNFSSKTGDTFIDAFAKKLKNGCKCKPANPISFHPLRPHQYTSQYKWIKLFFYTYQDGIIDNHVMFQLMSILYVLYL